MKNSLPLHEIECDKCNGTGLNYQPSIAELIKRWRFSLGMTQKVLATVCRIPITRYNKFEKGVCMLEQRRIKKIIETLEKWPDELIK